MKYIAYMIQFEQPIMKIKKNAEFCVKFALQIPEFTVAQCRAVPVWMVLGSSPSGEQQSKA